MSVLKRATGVNAYQRWQEYVESYSAASAETVGSSMYQNRHRVGLMVGGIQFLLPSYTETVSRVVNQSQGDKEFPVKTFVKNLPGVLPDIFSWQFIVLPMAMHAPVEAALTKVAINVGYPIASDLYFTAYDRIAQKISHLKPPSPATLAF